MHPFTEKTWDFIVVGTGMGGATLGHALAERGHSVLFVEKGRSHLSGDKALTDDYAELLTATAGGTAATQREGLAAGGRYNDAIEDISGSRPYSFIPFIGAGTGGSSALYGMALERFFPSDFAPREQHPHAGASSLPDKWPVSYAELAPYYVQAEQLYRVRGTVDPLRQAGDFRYLDPPALTTPNQKLARFLQNKGLHPYQLPMACEFVPNCQGCQSYLCSRNCKNDSSKTCLKPALEEHGAHLLDECEVMRLEAIDSRVNTIACRYKGEALTLRARRFVLAAGALETPRLLLSSTSPDWPQGLGNRSQLVGRNLMRHYIDLYAVLCRERLTRTDRVKELAFNDFYQHAGQKLGSVQSFGFLPPARLLVEEMEQDIRRDLGKLPGAAFRLVKPLARLGLGQLFSHALLLATTLEDLPYSHNRVQLAPDTDTLGRRRLQISYTIAEQEQARIDRFRHAMKQALRPRRHLTLKQAQNNQRIAHVCGTCRFGEDPATSVCDANHKVHATSNLYIADSSVFPSSGGINPSLTIAALSLRLAAHLGGKPHE